jgi:hypothetical protein
MKPTLGRVVHYRSKTGRYTLAADVIGTVNSLAPEGVAAGFVPALSTSEHVHLLVKTPGLPGNRLPDTDPAITADPKGGTYVEHNIPFWDPASLVKDEAWSPEDQPAGSWTWPPRV